MNAASPSPILRELQVLTRLALPVAVAQFASMMLWFVDLLMVGHVGVEVLDAASLGRTWLWTVLIPAMALLFGIDPIASQAHGARDRKTLGLSLQWGITVALVGSLPVIALLLLTEPILLIMGQAPHLASQAQAYNTVQLAGIPFFLLFVAQRQWLQARGIMRPTMWVTFLANGINFFGNWLLIFGNLGFPKMGLVGAGLATMITEIFMASSLALVIVRFRLHRGGWEGWSRRAFALRDLWAVLVIGAPVAIQIGLEFWAFALTTFFAGRIDAIALAAHTVVINLSSISFMAPLGISVAAVTRVGNLIGAGEPRRAQRAAWVAVALGGGVMLVSALCFVLFRWQLPRIYTADGAAIALCAAILPIAAAFQVFDGVQAVGGGVLRGMGRTLPAALFNAIGYYVLALPLGWWLAFHLKVGLAGIWWALASGLAVVAILLVLWIRWRGPATLTVPAGGASRRRV